MIDQASLAILIDCWADFPSQPYQPCREEKIQNIRSFCLSESSIEAIALSTYWQNNGLCLDHLWIEQSKQFFHDETKWDFLRQNWCAIEFSDKMHTHPLISDLPKKDSQARFVAANSLQILYYCNFINPAIRNIYLCGFAWDVCIKTRPVGWIELASLAKSGMFRHIPNILCDIRCVGAPYGHAEHFVPDRERWIPINDQVYQLSLNAANLFT